MREIKFRAWDRKKGKMFPVHQMQFGKIDDQLSYVSGVDIHDKDSGWDGDVFYGGSIHKMTGQPPLPRFEIMQYLGLRDKNGVDVYDKDIYRNLDNGLIGKFQLVDGVGGMYVLCTEYKTGRVYNNIPFMEHDTTNFEVIGSLYSNPELLGDGESNG